MFESGEPITELYRAMRAGDREAADRLFKLLYSELSECARNMLASEHKRDAICTARGLVHEAYARLVGHMPEVQDRQHLLNLLHQIMRRIKIDWVRRRQAVKRGVAVSLDTQNLKKAEAFEQKNEHRLSPVEAITVKEGLVRLGHDDSRLAELLELRFFGGKTIEEIAADLKLPTTSVHRDIKLAISKLAIILESDRDPHNDAREPL